MDILLYLTELLQTRKAVGLVGLGTLYKKKSPGRYDVEKHAFVPPSYSLAFTTELKEQEELANLISEKRKISSDSANYYIGEFVEKIQADLAERQEADLMPIGKLKLIDNQLVLITTAESNFSNEFYGLPTLSDLNLETKETIADAPIASTVDDENETTTVQDPIETAATKQEEAVDTIDTVVEENKLEEENPGQESGKESEEKELDEQPVYDEIAEVEPVVHEESNTSTAPIVETATPTNETEVAAPAETPIAPPPIVNYNYLEETDNDEDDDDDDGRPNKFVRILIKTIIVLILIVVAGAVSYFFFPGWFDGILKKTSELEPENSMTIHSSDTALVPIDSAAHADSLAKNNAMIGLAKDSIITTDTTNKVITYEVIGSAEKSQKRIDHVISTMQKRGIPAKALQNLPGRLTKISLGSFTDYNVAKAYQDSLKIKLKNPQIYIQSIKPKN